MAVSAFRSTTRRTCQIGSGSGGVAPESGSGGGGGGNPPSPAARGSSHRRTRSSSDFSNKYFSDSGSVSDCNSSRYDGKGMGRRRNGRAASHYMTSDSESDMDAACGSNRTLRRSFEVGSGRNFRHAGDNDALQKKPGLRRTSSHQDLSRSLPNNSRHLSHHNDFKKINDPEDCIEEKTIRAVYAQMKSLRRDPPTGDDEDSLYDAICAEVRQAVMEIRKDLEQSMKRNCPADSCAEEALSSSSKGTDVMQALAEMRKEYATKLEQSEKQVCELWSRLAVEEQRCREFSKILNELLPAPPASSSMSHRRKKSSDDHLLSKRLDEEAQKYFEDFIALSELDSSGDFEDIIRYTDRLSKSQTKLGPEEVETPPAPPTRVLNNQEIPAEKDVQNEEESKQSKGKVVESDGVVLPWLQWESESLANEKTPKKDGKKILSPRSSNIIESVTSHASNELGAKSVKCNNVASTGNVKSSSKGGAIVSLVNTAVSSLALPCNPRNVDSTPKPPSLREWSKEQQQQASSTTIEKSLSVKEPPKATTAEGRIDFDVDKFLVEKLRYSQRFERGEMLSCGSPLTFEIH